MLKRLYTWFFGYLFVRLKGYSPERFMNLCNNKNIYLWNIVHNEEGYTFFISLKDYRIIRPIAKKTRTIPYINHRYGLPFYLERYKKRQGFLLGVILCLFLIYIMSLFIWNIEIVGGYKYTKSTMLQYLQTIDVYSGMRKKQVNGKSIEEKIRISYPDIGWVSAEVRGTRLIIKLEETTMPESAKIKREPSHIAACKDGIILSIITRTGTPMVKAGAVVKKGDILVSGVVKVLGDNDTLVNQHPVVADADIKMKTFYEYKEKYPLEYKEKVYTKQSKNGFEFRLCGKKIISYTPRYSYKDYDIIKDDMSFHVTDSFYLPIEITKLNIREYKEYDRVYTEEEAISLAEQKLERYISYLTTNGVVILENRVQITCDQNSCIAKGKLIVEEPAWNYLNVNETEWRFENIDESSGNNS